MCMCCEKILDENEDQIEYYGCQEVIVASHLGEDEVQRRPLLCYRKKHQEFLLRTYYFDGELIPSEVVLVKYCPWCGRKLEPLGEED